MNSIDEDAKMLGIDQQIWKKMEKTTQDFLPNFLKADAEAREGSIDREAFIRRKQALAQRWFGYYRKCKDKKKKLKLIDQYNFVATMKQR